MATLVLTTLGTALGGPVGGALGSIIGQSIDRNLFGPPARRGPRLGDLSVQTSSYGSQIPRIYGRMRVAGTVVWATDLREDEVPSGGGKGASGGTGYAYSASFAVALSSREAERVGRIWADGKLLRASDGTFQAKVQFRFHPGSEQQAVDPLIASLEGTGGSPAFRGLALAVFEDLALGDYGNRIPSLTFELIADEAAPRVEEIISDAAGGLIEANGDDAELVGFAAFGSDRRSALEPLVDLWGGVYHDDGGKLRASASSDEPVDVGDAARSGCIVEGDRAVARVEREQEAAEAMPAALTIEYYDPERDFQTGHMRATVSTSGRSVRRIDSASAMDASTAKSLASDALARRWAGRDQVTLRLAPSFLAFKPGQMLAVEGVSGRYRVETVTLDGLVVVVVARRVPSPGRALAADAGRAVSDAFVAPGRSVPALADLPSMGVAGDEEFGLVLAVGSDGRFRPTTVVVEANGQPLATLRVDRAAVTGSATTVLASGPVCVIDRMSSVEVVLSDATALLYHADDDALAMGANAMLIGDEIIQFGRALAIGNGAYHLSNLVRGRRGTEWAVPGHVAGEAIVLLQADRLSSIKLDPAMLGAEVVARAYGVADDVVSPPVASVRAGGESLRPMSPCHLGADADASALTLHWVPRRAASMAWSAVTEADTATFEVTIRRGGQRLTRTTDAVTLTMAMAEIEALGSGPIEIEVIEQGPVPSRPALLTLAA